MIVIDILYGCVKGLFDGGGGEVRAGDDTTGLRGVALRNAASIVVVVIAAEGDDVIVT